MLLNLLASVQWDKVGIVIGIAAVAVTRGAKALQKRLPKAKRKSLPADRPPTKTKPRSLKSSAWNSPRANPFTR